MRLTRFERYFPDFNSRREAAFACKREEAGTGLAPHVGVERTLVSFELSGLALPPADHFVGGVLFASHVLGGKRVAVALLPTPDAARPL